MAEKAIQTFKNHFISILRECATTMPMHLWCQLLPQVELQLLLLQQSQVNPNMSVYAHLYRQHDYNKHPFVPIGMEALVHDKPHKQRTYAEHCRKHLSLAHPPSTINAGSFGQTTHRQPACREQHSSNTNISPTQQ
jgi:hypothetical protein